MQLEMLKNIVREAGLMALSYAGKFHHELKDDESPVTEADLLVQDFLQKRLKSLYPDYKFLGEEIFSSTPKESFTEDDYIWVVDPIDGTDSFREGLSSWGISIGLVHKFQPVLGIFYMPAIDTLFSSDQNGVAYENGRVLPPLHPHTSSSFYVTSDFHLEFDSTFPGKLRCMGSTVAHICYIARGAGCGALIRGFPWDLAAGLAILHAVGGQALTLDKKPFDFAWHMRNIRESVCLFISPSADTPDYISLFSKKTMT